jgi:threonylcarbamoyladenosine tRNA methylthiotransferase MtaB
MTQRKVSFYTLGCRLNQAETALMAESFRQKGYAVADHGSPVEVAVINTCSVTERADARCRHEIRKIRRRSPNAIVCAVGCYAQADTETVAAILGLDFVVGTDNKYAIAQMVEGHTRWPLPVVDVSPRPDTGEFDYPMAGYYPHQTRANIKIQDGCDFCCAFCLLPRVRGAARSRPMADIIAEGHELARRGHKELIIAGVNIGTYADEDRSIADIAQALSDIPDIERVRVSSIEPSTVGDDLLQWMVTSPKACRHLHLPLQSGDDSVLSRMKRVYTTSEFASFVDKVMRMMPDLGLGTDVIVGFPGETDAEFAQSMKFVEEMPFSYLHIFSYSQRPKTAAVHYDEKNRPQVVKERSDIMHELAAKKKQVFFNQHIGREVDVLFETVDDDGWRKGFTGSYLRVAADPDAVPLNEVSSVKVHDRTHDFCLART